MTSASDCCKSRQQTAPTVAVAKQIDIAVVIALPASDVDRALRQQAGQAERAALVGGERGAAVEQRQLQHRLAAHAHVGGPAVRSASAQRCGDKQGEEEQPAHGASLACA